MHGGQNRWDVPNVDDIVRAEDESVARVQRRRIGGDFHRSRVQCVGAFDVEEVRL